MVRRTSKKSKIHSSLRKKLLYIIKKLLRGQRMEYEINEVLNLKKECSNILHEYSNKESEASNRMKRLFLSH